MRKTIEVYLDDVLGSINKIEAYVKDLTLELFYRDTKTQDAVIRNIEIIGEAINRLPTEFYTKYPALPSKEAISMRNFLVHDYDSINHEVVWKTIKQDLPQLKKEIESILTKKN